MTQTELVSGRIAQVNAKGFKLDGQDRWLSYSQFGKAADVPRDAVVGEFVTVQISDKGFIQSLVRNGGNGQDVPRRSVYSEPKEHSDRQRSIVRQSCLRTAAQLVSGKCLADPGLEGKTTVEQLLHLAERFEEWIDRT